MVEEISLDLGEESKSRTATGRTVFVLLPAATIKYMEATCIAPDQEGGLANQCNNGQIVTVNGGPGPRSQDFAFIAAYEEGANAVSAASITPQATGRGMAINIALNSGIDAFCSDLLLGDLSCAQKACSKV
jgi:hypothetical protein